MKFWRKYHKWAGIVLSIFILLFALSGIVLNHREAFSSFDVSRQILPESYQYKNWNQAGVRGSLQIDSTQILVYGNIGVWKYNTKTKAFTDFNNGFDKGIDSKKLFKIVSYNNELFAAGQFGLFRFTNKWKRISNTGLESQIRDLVIANDKLYILSRSEIFKFKSKDESLEKVNLAFPENTKREQSLFKTIWTFHSGEIFGLGGKLFVDFLGVLLIFLSITGIIFLLFPKWIKKRKTNNKAFNKIRSGFRLSVKWHNKLGVYSLIFIILLSLSGIFLRPPLLIPIASKKIPIIPGSMFDTENYWHDKLRAISYNELRKVFFISTSEGFFACPKDFSSVYKFPLQTPVSVMGINVFEALDKERFLIGSFSGLFIWNPFEETCINAYTGRRPLQKSGRPTSEHMISGFVKHNEQLEIIDYASGIENSKNWFPTHMPNDIIEKSPMSLWNLALEVHTCRIFEPILGMFYILLVPLSGIALILLCISGYLVWRKYYKKKA